MLNSSDDFLNYLSEPKSIITEKALPESLELKNVKNYESFIQHLESLKNKVDAINNIFLKSIEVCDFENSKEEIESNFVLLIEWIERKIKSYLDDVMPNLIEDLKKLGMKYEASCFGVIERRVYI